MNTKAPLQQKCNLGENRLCTDADTDDIKTGNR